MHGYLIRDATEGLQKALARAPAVLLLGPRQCGKSTLARQLLAELARANRDAALILDLQDRTDRARLREPELFFEAHRRRLVCLDEIQLLPAFFSLLRAEIDRDRRPGRFLLLGSASGPLLRQSHESLAGRIAQLELTPFLLTEVAKVASWQELWLRGGFPESLVAASQEDSIEWREDFIRTFLGRDIASLELGLPLPLMDRLWRLLAHSQGQTLNASRLAGLLDLRSARLQKLLAVLEQTFMLRRLPPLEANLSKRLVRSPKLYLRDSGLLHNLLGIETYDDLLAHPQAGESWEGFVIEQLVASHPRWRPHFLRTSNGAELDLVLERGQRRRVYEIKLSKAPKLSRGFHDLVETLQPERAELIAPVDVSFELRRGIWVRPPLEASRSDPAP
ncbi:MAG: ATP-binding protein [Synechococcaceae cyanobacterium]|nr:ATP-binding protein [Synechococcaceae cyanobacterium]